MSNIEELVALVQEYYSVISRDHHKDRDCHFYVTLRVSAYEPHIRYEVDHPGYVDSWDANVLSIEQGIDLHIANLRAAIPEARKHAEEWGY